ncbi:MAG: ABC transporter ATP-binding protein [Boseongicola sp.]|nr:ABC transporter ATP-binding protein [Boseongicola sp.]
MLEVRNLTAAYGQHPALKDVSLTVGAGEIVVILGANGAGKSTLLRAISGICEGKVGGEVMLGGQLLSGHSSDEIVERGVALVPEGRGIFGDLTVKENLLLGAYPARARSDGAANLDRVLGLFPKLRERQGQVARTMSGGEQQMVAIGRAMMSAPDILMLDEPSLGLSPLLCKELFQNLAHVKDLGIGVLLVEQNAKQSLAIADRGYLLENTQIVHEDKADRLAKDPAVQKAYLGATSKAATKTNAKSAPRHSAEPAPAVRFSSISATPRRTAEQQIGMSIDDMVRNAARQSASAPRGIAPDVALAADRLAKDRLSVVIKDIEAAAKSARNRKANKPPTPSTPSYSSAPQGAKDEGPAPVIEVYRRPVVEVYRRRPSGQFERD